MKKLTLFTLFLSSLVFATAGSADVVTGQSFSGLNESSETEALREKNETRGGGGGCQFWWDCNGGG